MDSDRPQTELTSAELDRGLTSEAQALHEEQPFLDAPGESVYEHFELQLGDGQCDAAYLPPYEASNGPPPTYDSPPPPYETSSSETNDEEDWLFNARQDAAAIIILTVVFVTVFSAALISLLTTA
ncbi:DNA polymerase [Gallid alphaherpesvirus 3]|uniref:DNA polymerase n=1 Tax=Gallid alphaherpesvirus 3 TaxID=35250 RepID=F8TC58_9ALPH|nr:DNA polymerase [Gallid alphaherpesvirus 3]AEI00269.1 DNA polymerase [Gallid alphaherpesvirus 3]QEY02293.1 DNA polymerase [Gallid alphaherpesvirus 3]